MRYYFDKYRGARSPSRSSYALFEIASGCDVD